MTCAVCGFDPESLPGTRGNYRWWVHANDRLCSVCASWALRTLPFAAWGLR